jgi:type IV secretion system protein TrbL
MEIRTQFTHRVVSPWLVLALLLVAAFVFATSAHAELSSKDLADTILRKYQTAATGWETAILNETKWLFWKLALISLVISAVALVVKGTELGEFAVELTRWIIFTGIFYWLLTEGPTYARNIIDSMRILGSTATGAGKEIYPSDVLDIGFKIYQKAIAQVSLWNGASSFLVALVAVIILCMTAWICCNILLLLCASWIVLEAGAIFLAFGAAPFFRDIAISYYRAILAIGAALLTMELIIGIGTQFLLSLVGMMGNEANAGEMGVLLIATIILAVISHRVPNMVAGIIGGTHGVGHTGLMTALAFGALAGKIVAGAMSEGASKAESDGARPTLDAIRQGERAAAGSDGNGERAASNGESNGNGASKEETVNRS